MMMSASAPGVRPSPLVFLDDLSVARGWKIESSCIMDKISRWYIIPGGVIAIEMIMENVNLKRGLTSSSLIAEKIIELAYRSPSDY